MLGLGQISVQPLSILVCVHVIFFFPYEPWSSHISRTMKTLPAYLQSQGDD